MSSNMGQFTGVKSSKSAQFALINKGWVWRCTSIICQYVQNRGMSNFKNIELLSESELK
jgi:hypothetical protein